MFTARKHSQINTQTLYENCSSLLGYVVIERGNNQFHDVDVFGRLDKLYDEVVDFERCKEKVTFGRTSQMAKYEYKI